MGKAEKQKSPAHHVVSRLRVTGGFLAGLDLELAHGLNCFIGGRGTGKTTALEFLRYRLKISLLDRFVENETSALERELDLPERAYAYIRQYY